MKIKDSLLLRIAIIVGTAIAMLMVVDITFEPRAHADPAACIIQPWGFLGSQQRGLCDGPIRADGSWVRHRVIAQAAHYVPVTGTTNCFGTSFISCSSYSSGGYFAPYREFDNEFYVVTPETVLQDEPGHIN
jgi:hypothetical protein